MVDLLLEERGGERAEDGYRPAVERQVVLLSDVLGRVSVRGA